MEHLMLSEIENTSTERLLELIGQKRVSVLEAYGKKWLHRSLLPIRWLVGFALKIIFRHSHLFATYLDAPFDPVARTYAVKLLKRFTPYKLVRDREDALARMKTATLTPVDVADKVFRVTDPGKYPIVLGFNHPSLGETARLIALCFEQFPEKELILPVTLPWYEMFAPFEAKFRSLGIRLAPIVTPHATETLLKGVDYGATVLDGLRGRLQMRYLKDCVEVAKHGGIVLLAPSAQRQATIFPSPDTFIKLKPLTPTATLIARKILAGGVKNLFILPVCVIPPRRHTKGVNLFKRYQLVCCVPFTEKDFRYHGNGEFEYQFYRRLALVPEAKGLRFPATD